MIIGERGPELVTLPRSRRDAIVRAARALVGTRWRHQGRNTYGLDCIGLVGLVAMQVGIPEAKEWANDPEAQGYGRQPDPAMLFKLADRYLDRKDVAEVGDILVVIAPKDTEPRHFAIVTALDPMYVVHALAQARKVTEHRVDDEMRSRIVATYSFRGL